MTSTKTRLSVRFYKYFVSYISLTLILLLAVGSLVYGRMSELLQDNVEHVSSTVLAEVKLMTEVRLQDLERIALQIPLNPMLSPYALANGGYESYAALNQIRMYAAGSSFIYDIAVGYGSDETIQTLSTSGSYDFPSFLKLYAFTAPYDELIAEHVTASKKPLLISPYSHPYPVEGDSLLYVYPLPGSRGEELRFVNFVISERQFTSMINRVLQGYDGYFYILDDTKKLITSTRFGNIRGERERWLPSAMEEPGGGLPRNEDDPSMSFIRFQSETNGWTYVLVMPKEQFQDETTAMRRIYYLAVFGIFLLGLLLSYLFAKQNYRPWKQLASTVNSGSAKEWMAAHSNGTQATNDEYSLVTQAFDELTRKNSSLYSQMKTGSRLLKEQYVIWMIRGEEERRKEAAAMLDRPRFLLTHPAYAVMLFMIDNASDFNRLNSPQQREALMFALMNIAEELAEESGERYALRLPDTSSVALVLNLKRTAANNENLTQLAKQAIRVYSQYFRYSLTAGISSVYEDYKRLGPSLKEAETAARYRYYQGPGNAIAYEDVRQLLDNPYQYQPQNEHRLMLALKQGNQAEAAQTIGDIAADMRRQLVHPGTAREVWKRLGGEIVRSLGDMNGMWIQQERQALEQFYEETSEQLTETERRLTNICANLCEAVESGKESKNTALLDRLMQLLHQRYTDNTISLDVIAEEVGLSPSYATRFFKDHTGFSLIQYIDKLRMDKAKELLRTTDWKIGEVIERSGYVDEANFRRKFLKQEGVSPIKYRAISRME
ncbi:AraC family transcriptional regulator [Paenibacillus antri]|uniref:AraC family transcriptional regulator n=1 Tax=Paenibacillus antri TaxID=2582848 RepID=A0A5R9G626_9BACL|nr:AraC family transcriptional regulator [Paenibacillus antri]TLS51827.1 AraC family transcriptional regulator [Paenibacillus antri]